MNISDTNATDGTATKEIAEIKEVLRRLSHRSDEKVTYTNGFHVNQAVTSTDKVYIDENHFSPDYDNFFKCAQPIIDEEAINPTEFTLLCGLYLTKYANNFTCRKNRRYLGALVPRDYQYLDYKLLNLDRTLRKYMAASLEGVDEQANEYACHRLQTSHQQYSASANLQREVFREKRIFSK